MENLKINRQEPVNENFLGNNAIFHGYAGMPDFKGRVYDERQCELEADRIKDLGIKIVRTYTKWWAWDRENGWNWDNEIMTAFYKWCRRMQVRDVDIAIHGGWCLGDMTKTAWGGDGPFSDGDVDFYTACDNFAEYVSEMLHQLIEVRGFTNIKYLMLFTEPTHVRKEFEGLNALQMWEVASRRIHNRLVADGRRHLVKLVGPNENARYFGYPKELKYARQTADDFLDFYSCHIYERQCIDSREDILSGNRAITFTTPGQRVQQEVFLEKGKNYKFSVNVKVSDEDLKHLSGYLIYGFFEEPVVNAKGQAVFTAGGQPTTRLEIGSTKLICPTQCAGKWQEFSIEYTPKEDVKAVVGIFNDIKTKTAAAFVDDLSLTLDGSENLLKNPSFEDEDLSWTAVGSEPVAYDMYNDFVLFVEKMQNIIGDRKLWYYRRTGTANTHRMDKTKLFEEYPAYGGLFFDNESLKITFPDGVRDTVLKHSGYELSKDKNSLTVILKDEYYPLTVKLHYQIFEGLDLIDRNCEIINECDGEICLETFDSANWCLPYNENYRLTYMASSVLHEYEIKETDVGLNTVTLQSKSGKSNTHNFPYFAIDNHLATEHSGDVYFGTLQWSGNWQIKVGMNGARDTKVTGGISNFDCQIYLKPGESFRTPKFTGGFVTEGFGAASRQFHDYQRMNTHTQFTNKVMPMVYSTWSTFKFNIDEELFKEQAKRAADMGMEIILIDDGWFGHRNNDKGGLGDWYPSPDKFPNGLKATIDYANSLGLKFGIWIEPEMISEDSDLFKEHPDWIMNYKTRKNHLQRNQLILNFAREDVYQFTEKWVDDLLTNYNIEYLKTDMNRYFSEAGWPEVDEKEQKTIWIKYVNNLYRLFDFINKKHPNVLLENCAEGGTRTDMSMTKWCARCNRSDNQDPIDVLQLHQGFTRVNLAKAAGGVGHMHRIPNYVNGRRATYKFMAFVGFNASYSCGLDLRSLTEEEVQEIKGYVEFYKKIRETVQLGDMYVLNSAFDKNGKVVSFQYVSKDKSKSVILVYANNNGFRVWVPPIMPKGLDKNRTYDLSVVGSNWDVAGEYKGDTLMNFGISHEMQPLKDAVYDAFAIVLEEKK